MPRAGVPPGKPFDGKIFMNTRRSSILEYLSKQGQASVQELCDRFGVSLVTIRQDLTTLEKAGFLHRTHGGATLLDSENIAQRLSFRYDKKLEIAKWAAGLVEDGETVFLESGSANALLARELAGRRVQLVVANLFMARQIKHGDLARVVVIGGMYQPDSESLVGAMARQNIAGTFFTKAFLGMDGFTPETGFTNRDMERAEIAQTIVRHCPSTYVLADSSKFGSIAMARICGLDELAGVITNKDLGKDFVKAIRKSRAELFLV